jgi:hypothetical protein
MTLKQKIYKHYLQIVNEKVNLLQQVLAGLKESGSNETKSTAGDKHETALAMLQIEQANTRGQMQEALLQQASFQKINQTSNSAIIINGSLIKTNRGYLYMSIALGKAMIDGQEVIALSPQSPLGKKLLGLTAGDAAEVNGNRYIIETVL